MRTINELILFVSSNVLKEIYIGQRHDNWEKSPYYHGLTKQEKEILSKYIVNKYNKNEKHENCAIESMYNLETIFEFLSNELKEMSLKHGTI